MYLISLFFMALAWFGSFLACCGRLGSAIAFLLSGAALFFLTIAVSLMTYVSPLFPPLPSNPILQMLTCPPHSATFVKARNAFLSAGREATIGTYAFGFSWGAWAALLIATVLFCIGIRGEKGGVKSPSRFSRKRSVRSRRSFDVGSSRRVKDDYA